MPVTDPSIREFVIPITHDTVEIAKGVKYEGWTFGGTVPGPVIRVREGDRVRIKVVNKAPMPHSIDFHSARIPANIAYRTINTGDTVSFEFTARDPGAYMVHCGTPPVTMHVMQGMYFAIIVDPEGRLGHGRRTRSSCSSRASSTRRRIPRPARSHPTGRPPWPRTPAMWSSTAGQVSTRTTPLKVDVGDRVRLFVVNAGPSFRSDFHIVGAVFDRVYPDGNPDHVLEGVQTYTVPAGGGVVFETVFDKDASGEGLYPFVTHSFADAEKGAVGIIQVGTPKQHTTMSH